MAEGSPEMNNQMNGAVATTQPQTGETAAQELVFAYAQKLPPQLEHWIRKRSMRLHQNESLAVNPAEIKAQGARFVVIDLDTHRDRPGVEVVRSLRQAIPELRIIVISSHSDDMFVR